MEEHKHPNREFIISKAVGANKNLLPYRYFEPEDVPAAVRSAHMLLCGILLSNGLVGPSSVMRLMPLFGFAGTLLIAAGSRFFGSTSKPMKLVRWVAVPLTVLSAAYGVADIFAGYWLTTTGYGAVAEYASYVCRLILLSLLYWGIPEVLPCKKVEVALLLPLYLLQWILLKFWGSRSTFAVTFAIVVALSVLSIILVLRMYWVCKREFSKTE